MRKGSLLELAIGRGEGGGTFGVAVPQVPEHTATDHGGQIDPIGETATVFLIGQKVCRQRQATLDQYRDQAVVSQGTDQAIEGHGGEMVATHSKLRPPWVAIKACRATSGLMRR